MHNAVGTHSEQNSTYINKGNDLTYITTIHDDGSMSINRKLCLISSILHVEHPSILSINYFSKYNYNGCIIYKICPYNYYSISLQSILDSLHSNSFNLTETDYYIIILGIALGINYLHSNEISNINLMPTNIYFEKKWYPKIFKIDLFNAVNGNFSNTHEVYDFALIMYQLITKQNLPIQIDCIQNDNIKNFIKRCISNEEFLIPTFRDIVYFITSKSFRSNFGQIEINKVINYLRLFNRNQNDYESFFVLGSFLYESQTKKDKEEALDILKKAADIGNINSILLYNSILVRNDKTGQKRDEILKYYQIAISDGNLKATYDCAFYLQRNIKTKEDEEKVKHLYKTAADGGHTFARYQYGLILYKLNRKTEAAFYFKLAADFGDIKSIYTYALMLESGNGIERDINKAIVYYKKGMEYGDFNSMNNYAQIIFHNNNDKKRAVQLFKISADNGNKYAMCNYAYARYNGQGIEINKDDAIKYYQKSIENGNPEAMIQYGRIIELSNGESNIQQAANLYKMAAEKGNIDGMNNLISLLLKGNNIEISTEEIINYCKKSIAEGKIKSMIYYAKYLKKDINDPNSIHELMSYLKKSADLGNVYSIYQYSSILYNDYIKEKNSDILSEMKKYTLEAVKKRYKKAILLYIKILKLENSDDKEITIWLGKAAELGSISSMIKYVKMHNDNKGILCDIGTIRKFFKEANKKQNKTLIKLLLKTIISDEIEVKYNSDLVSYIEIASNDLKIPEAMYKLGVLLLNGECFEKDYEKGIDYIKKAADLGVLEAMRDLSDISKKGNIDYNSDYFLNEFQKYESILIDYKKNNNKVFVDDNFPPNKNWRRIDDIYKMPLFKKDLIDQNFIIQGSIGNCYLISFLSRVAKQHYLIKSLFEHNLPDTILGAVENSINIKCGAVVIYFYAFGKKIPVLIDTLIPMKNDVPLFSRPSDIEKSAWFCLVEKAYAKLRGSYYNIVSGHISLPSYSLFFYYSKHLKREENNHNLFEKFMKYQEKGCISDASIHDNIKIKGLYKNHSYMILKIREVDNEKIFCLRNPWGSKEFSGKYSRNSPLWTPHLKKLLDYDHCQMGTFFMTEEEFFKYFNKYVISKPILPKWIIKSFTCQFSPGQNDGINYKNISTCLINHQAFAFQITDPLPADEKIKIHINVEICSSTFHDQITNKDYIGNYLIFFGHTNGKKFDENTCKDNALYSYEFGKVEIQSFKYEVKGNEIITILLQRTFEKDYIENCYVSVFCKYNFKLYDIDNPDIMLPDVANPGIVFDNSTISFPNISKPLVLDFFKDRLILNFGSPSCQNDLSKLFQYANKKIWFSHVDLNDFINTGRIIGRGSNGNVYKIKEKKTQKLFAAKISKHEITKENKFFRELISLQSIKYPSIIDYKGYSEHDFNGKSHPTIITEYLEEGNLYDLLWNEKNGSICLTSTNKMIIVIGIALGMDYLHRHKIIHRDLKFHNIVLDNLHPKICDLGESKLLDSEFDLSHTIYVGTKRFMAPEIAKNNGNYSYPVDVYSFGVMLYYIYTNQVPEDPLNITMLDKKYSNFICNLIDNDPNKRLTFRQIVELLLTDKENTWIDDVDEKEVEEYIHKFGLSMVKKSQEINFDIINSINEDIYPFNAKKPKFTIQQLMENEMIPKQIRDDIALAENTINHLNLHSINENEMDEVGRFLNKTAKYFITNDNESDLVIDDLYYFIKYLKAAALCKHKRSINTLAYLFSNDSNPNIQKIAFNIACLDADLEDINGFNILGFFYKMGIGIKSNVAMSAINFKIAADLGDVESMLEYSNILFLIGQHEFDINKLEFQIKEAEIIIQKMDGKKNYIYNEIRLTLDTLKNETAALYVSVKYLEKAAKCGSKDANDKISLIKTILSKYEDYPQYYDDLFESLD